MKNIAIFTPHAHIGAFFHLYSYRCCCCWRFMVLLLKHFLCCFWLCAFENKPQNVEKNKRRKCWLLLLLVLPSSDSSVSSFIREFFLSFNQETIFCTLLFLVIFLHFKIKNLSIAFILQTSQPS